jgi:hypothetical protein
MRRGLARSPGVYVVATLSQHLSSNVQLRPARRRMTRHFEVTAGQRACSAFLDAEEARGSNPLAPTKKRQVRHSIALFVGLERTDRAAEFGVDRPLLDEMSSTFPRVRQRSGRLARGSLVRVMAGCHAVPRTYPFTSSTRFRLRFWLFVDFLCRPHSPLGCCRSLEHCKGYQPRHAGCHLHHPAEDAQSPAHGIEDGIPELGLLRVGLAFRHSSTHALILTRCGRGVRDGFLTPPSRRRLGVRRLGDHLEVGMRGPGQHRPGLRERQLVRPRHRRVRG